MKYISAQACTRRSTIWAWLSYLSRQLSYGLGHSSKLATLWLERMYRFLLLLLLQKCELDISMKKSTFSASSSSRTVVSMMMIVLFCSWTICQKSAEVESNGPCKQEKDSAMSLFLVSKCLKTLLSNFQSKKFTFSTLARTKGSSDLQLLVINNDSLSNFPGLHARPSWSFVLNQPQYS